MKIRMIIIAMCMVVLAVSLIAVSAEEAISESDSIVTETEFSTEEETMEMEAFSWEVIPSKYQSTRGYEWEDLYVILMLLTKTSQHLEGGTPVFSLVSIKQEYEPLFIIGWNNMETDTQYYKMYIMDEENVYELLETNDTILWDYEKQTFYLEEEQAWISYVPHVLLKEAADEKPDTIEPLQQISLFQESVTSETIHSYLQEVIAQEEEEIETEELSSEAESYTVNAMIVDEWGL